MANRDLLADAIADAKAVKEVAIANAKAALEEAFTPHLKNMLAQKINEMDELEETDLAEVDKEKQEEAEMKMKKEGYGKKEMEEANDSMDEELDLEEILAELELEEADETNEGEEVKEGEDPMEEGEDPMEEADMTYEAEEGEEAEEEINLEDMSEEELKSMIEDVIEDMIEDGELVPGPNADESEAEEAEDTDDGMEGDADVDIEVDDIDLEEVKAENEEMKEDLEEAKKAIKYLRSELNEVNLLNSKLLYTNKIFRGKNLTENQKIKVLKAFDKAETVKEAKTIFETLNENLVAKSATKSPLRESRGAASKPAGVAPKRPLNEGIIQEDAMVARFKKLAGIIK